MGTMITRMRKRVGLSQVQLAKRMGVTQGAISQWESGQAKPRTDLLFKLADVLGCSVDELLKPKKKEG
jgi:transcriptional regulator with XRE-family HTH domain